MEPEGVTLVFKDPGLDDSLLGRRKKKKKKKSNWYSSVRENKSLTRK